MKQAESRADHCRGKNANTEVRPHIDRGPTYHGAGGHDAFNAEIENTGALAQQLTKRRQQQRTGNADGCGPEPGVNQNFKQIEQHQQLIP